ncbi:hypothetical protein [Lysobacter tyrosinilyticus]
MGRFLIVLIAALLSACAQSSPSAAQIKADYARIDPRCTNIFIDDIEQDDRGVWVTITEKCHSSNDGQMQLQYKKTGSKWAVAWYAPVLYD